MVKKITIKKRIASSAMALWAMLAPLSATPGAGGVCPVGGVAVRTLDHVVRIYGYWRVINVILDEMRPEAKEKMGPRAPQGKSSADKRKGESCNLIKVAVTSIWRTS